MISNTIFSISLWDIYQKEGREALENGDLEGAADRFQSALEKAGKYGAKDPRIATSKRCLGTVRQRQGKLDEAENLYKEAIELLEEQLGPESVALVKVLICQKTLLSEQNRNDELQDVIARLDKIRDKAQESLGTSDIFEEEMPENADEVPMSSEQAMRIQELLNREEVSDKTRMEVETMLRDNPSYQWAHETQGRLRQEIVKSYQPSFHDKKDEEKK